MHRAFEWLLRTKEEAVKGLRGPKWGLAFLTLSVLAVAGVLAGAAVLEGLRRLLPYILAFAAMPVGIVGLSFLLALFVLMAGLFVIAFVKTREKPAPPSVPPEPTPEERLALNDLRAFYRTYARDAMNLAANLLDGAMHNLMNRSPFSVLLQFPLGTLQSNIKGLSEATSDKNPAPFEEALRRLDPAFQSYRAAMRWVHMAEVEGLNLKAAEPGSPYVRWMKAHEEMLKALRELTNRSGFHELRALPNEMAAWIDGGQYEAREHKAKARFQRATDAERRFLERFTGKEPAPDPENPETWLSNELYRAGEALARDGFLESERIEVDEKEVAGRFSLTEYSHLAIQGTIQVVQTVFEVPLSAVFSSGNVGSGAGLNPQTSPPSFQRRGGKEPDS